MTRFLVKCFVKDKENITNCKVREQYGILASAVGVICNLFLFAVKMSVGLVLNSISVTADAFNNLSDAASSVIAFIGAKLASRPSDEEHPFGHGRYEYIAAFIVAFLVLQVGFSCFTSSIDKIRNPEAIGFSPVLAGILAASILVKLWLGLFNRKLGKLIDSSVMKATAMDAFGDMLITFVTVASIFVGHFTGWKVDGYMGLIVSLFVMYAGIGIIKETLEPLIGAAVSEDTYEMITEFVESYDGIIGSHDLIVHSYGPSHTMATIHAEVPVDCDLERTHEMIDRIECQAREKLSLFLVIHMDPVEVNNEEVDIAKKMVANASKEILECATIHDFRMVKGEEQINLLFDIVLPHDYVGEKRMQLLTQLRDRIALEDERYHCIITVDHSFVNKKKN